MNAKTVTYRKPVTYRPSRATWLEEEREPLEVFTCECCGEPILEGEEFWELKGFGIFCEACISDAHHYDANLDC